jgi:2-polyprenyl-3-methyl-5-hydroxy-6-metoxy-1,4-benzoquinol methylase
MKKELVENKGERTMPRTISTFEFERIYFYVCKHFGDKDKIVLDYGCGSGYGTNILSASFSKVIGVDVSDDAIDFCSSSFQKDNLSFFSLNTKLRPFDDSTFDFIFSFQVFEHIEKAELQSYLTYIFQMLKLGGKAIITTPNSFNYNDGYSGNEHHVHEYSHTELILLLDKHLPKGSYKINFIEDVFSTRLSLKIRKYFKNGYFAKLISFTLKRIILPFEMMIFSISKANLKVHNTNIEKKFGSFYIEIIKEI